MSAKPVLLALASISLVVSSACHAEDYRVYYPGNYFGEVDRSIDMDSIVRTGNRVRYFTKYFSSHYKREVHELIVGDCVERKRAQVQRNEDSETVQMYSVFDGTKTGIELDIACGKSSPPVSVYRDPNQWVSSNGIPKLAETAPTRKVKSGSGFVVARERVITNFHVVNQCAKVHVQHGDDRRSAMILRTSSESDLALLQVDGLSSVTEAGVRANALLGEDVTVAGYPLAGVLASDLVVTSGQVNALAGLGNDRTALQISAPIQPGNSGGPLIDRAGNVVGVVAYKLNVSRFERISGDVAQNVNFAIKPEMLRLFLDAADVRYRAVGFDKRIDNVEIAQAARTYTVKIECD